ncbi:glycoside hydrolase family 15 protein [Caldisphaera sp.]|uniref:glycoside hydrolase family 15 protein n=1 Tax=Caldisphaera sp. TaxID=2060322 RepID=UPI00397C2561
MARLAMVSNGTIAALYDGNFYIRSIYYPMLDQHHNHSVNGVFKIGLWKDGQMIWLENVDKSIEMDNLIARAIFGLSDGTVELTSLASQTRPAIITKVSIRGEGLFRFIQYNDFRLNNSELGDTALYDPHLDAVIHYKGSTWFAVTSSHKLYEYTTGRRDQGGVLKDCQDGTLDKNPIAQGSADSAISIAAKDFYLYIVAGKSYNDLVESVKDLRTKPGEHFERDSKYWSILTETFKDAKILKQSIAVLLGHMGNSGEVPASLDTSILKFNLDTYAYTWPRDAVHVAIALDSMGYWSFTRRFYEKLFTELMTPEGYLYQKYNADGTFGSTWHPWTSETEISKNIQEDEIALAVYGFWYHVVRSNDYFLLREVYENLERAADFMASFINEKLSLPLMSYDLWEERLGVHAYTVAALYAAMKSAADIARRLGVWSKEDKWRRLAKVFQNGFREHMFNKDGGYFYRMITIDKEKVVDVDKTVDSSTLAAGLFGLVEPSDPMFDSTVKVVKDKLWVNSVGGLARYENDYYQRINANYAGITGNPWIITTLWLAQAYILQGNPNAAKQLLSWVNSIASPTGMLPEQVSPFGSTPLSVMPLAWSHAEYVKTHVTLNGGSFMPPT